MRVDWRNTFLPGKGWQVACFLISVTFSVRLAATFDLAAFLVSMDAFHYAKLTGQNQWENPRKAYFKFFYQIP